MFFISDDKETSDDHTSETEKIKPIYVQVSQGIRDIIDMYKKRDNKTISGIIEEAITIYDTFTSKSSEMLAILEKYKDKYENESKIIEEAIKLFDKQKDPEMADDLDLWCRAREEMEMMLIGKTTFNQLLTAAEAPKESLDKPMKRNIALDVILWYTGRPIRSLSLEEIINAIKKVWIVANYFYFIDIKKESEDQYHLIFKHRQNKRYSNYWLGYFKELFLSEDLLMKCAVEGEAFDETLSLTIKLLHNKRREK